MSTPARCRITALRLLLLGSFAIGVLCGPVHAAGQTAERDSIDVWLITADPGGAVARGARMGAAEMNQTATLLGRRFVLRELHAESREAAASTIAALRGQQRAAFLVLDLEPAAACGVAEALRASRQVIVFNARIANGTCAPGWLQLRLPADRRASLLRRDGPRQDEGHAIDEWHHALRRFGAGELNERYERRTRHKMDGDAWAGWFAAKAAAEAALRSDAVTAESFTGDTPLSFDGHKGVPLRFDSHGVLRQPVYLIARATEGRTTVLKELR